MKDKKVVALTVAELEVVLCQLVDSLELDIDIPSVIKRAKAGEQGKYQLQELQIQVVEQTERRSKKELMNAYLKIKRWLMVGQSTVMRYIRADEEYVISRHL